MSAAFSFLLIVLSALCKDTVFLYLYLVLFLHSNPICEITVTHRLASHWLALACPWKELFSTYLIWRCDLQESQHRPSVISTLYAFDLTFCVLVTLMSYYSLVK